MREPTHPERPTEDPAASALLELGANLLLNLPLVGALHASGPVEIPYLREVAPLADELL